MQKADAGSYPTPDLSVHDARGRFWVPRRARVKLQELLLDWCEARRRGSENQIRLELAQWAAAVTYVAKEFFQLL
jgi:hypothetical protein